ncbi:MAG: hypothetical protein J6Y02_06655 [Pseudobutyrivibrio sp.]|nr:hypothetical protein [Pseudobutyrivibrio sp.]
MNSAEVKDFQYALETYINANTLPLEVKRMVLKDIYVTIAGKANEEILQQLREREAKQEENKDA